MLKTLSNKINAMITDWEKNLQQAEASKFTHDGAIQAARLILKEIEGMENGNNTSTSTEENIQKPN